MTDRLIASSNYSTGQLVQTDENGITHDAYQSDLPRNIKRDFSSQRPQFGVNLYELAQRNDEKGVWARTVLDVVSASRKANDAEYTHRKDMERLFRTYGERFEEGTITDRDLQILQSDEYIKQYSEMTDAYGAPTEHMINNEQFVRNVSAETYAYLGTAYNTIHKHGFLGEWERNVNYADVSRANDYDLANGKKDYETYLRDKAIINSRYKLEDDRSYVGGVASVVEGMIKPVVDNPVPALGGAFLFALGSATGVTELGFLGSTIFMAGTQGVNASKLAQAEILDNVYQENPNADREDVINSTWWAWGAVGLMNTADPLVTMKVAGLGKVAGSAISWTKGKIFQDVANSQAVNALEQATGKKVKERLGQVVSATLRTYGADTAIEVAQEGSEGAVTTLGSEMFLNHTWSEAFKNSYDNAVLNMKEALVPSAIIGGAIHTPHTLARLHDVHRSYKELKQNVEGRVAEEVVSQSEDAQRDPDTIAEVATDAIQDSRVYIDADLARQNLEQDGLGVTDYGRGFQKLLDKDHHGERIVLNQWTYAKLPQQVRDSLASATSNRDGRPVPQNVRETLSESKIKELQAEFAKTQQEVIARENARLEVKKKLDEDIRNNSNLKRKQQSFVANVASSFMSAMSEVTGIDINSLYERFKPTYQMVDELDLSKNKKRINQKGITGTFNNKTNTIQLTPNSDFNTVFHETAHWYLNVMRGLSKENAQIELGFKELAKWAGFEGDIKNMTDAEFNMISEKFVAGFTLSMLAPNKSKNKAFTGFKKFLFSLRNQSIFSNLKENEDKTEHLKKGFETTYGEPLPEINESFLNIINGMFAGDVLNEIQEMDYPRDNYLKVIDSVPDVNGLKAELKKELTETLQKVDGDIEHATHILSIKEALIKSLKNDDMGKVLQDMIKNMKPNTRVKAYVDRLLKGIEDFKEERKRLTEKLKETPLYKYLDTVKEFKINPLGLSEEMKKQLQAKGYLSEDGLTATDLCNKLPDFVEKMLDNSNLSREQAFLQFVAQTPTINQRATELAMNKVIRTFAYDLAKSVRNIEKASAVTHKSIAEAVLKALHKALGFKDSVKKVKAEIEQVAEIDVGQMKYKDVSARAMLGNASQESKKVQKALAEGDMEGAVSHTRNEYYLNHKAEYASEMKLYIDKKLSDFKAFIVRTDKSLSKNYDVDLVELMRHTMWKMGLTDKNPHIDPNQMLPKLQERYPQQAEAIRDMVETINGVGSVYTDLSYNELNNAIDMLNAMKGLSHETRIAVIGKEKIEQAKVVDEMAEKLAEHNDKIKGLEKTKEGGVASTRKKTLGGKIGELWREFSHSFTLVENLCQQIDKATLGVFHKYIYQVGKDAEVQYKLAKDKYTKIVGDALRKITKISAEPIEAFELRRRGMKEGEHWTIGKGKFTGQSTLELMGMILHMGTNLEKFLDGYLEDNPKYGTDRQAQLQWKKEQWDKFFNRMVDEGHITKEMLDACQVVWDCNEEIAEQVNEASRRVRGFPFKKLPSRTVVVTIDKKEYTYTAGYMPAMANEDIVPPHTTPTEDIYEQFNMLGQELPVSEPSFLKDRTAKAYELELDPVKLIGKMNDTLRYAYVMPAVVQIKKTLDDPKIRQTLDTKYPDVYEQVFMPWLKGLATMQSAQPAGKLGRFISHFVRGSAMQIMVGNLNNALQQFSNIATLLLRVSPAELIRCMPVIFNSELKAQILQESDFMRVRIREMNDGINEIFSELMLDGRAFESLALNAKAKIKKAQYVTNKHAYLAQKLTQNVIDYVGYMSAKNTALKKGMSEQEAIHYAEATVRNCLGSFDLADVASIQRSNAYVKMLTMFGGYFYSMWRLMETEVKNAFANYGVTDYRRYAHATMGVGLAIVAPAIVAELINGIVGQGNWGDDDDEIDLLKSNLFWAPFRMASASFPIIGRLANTGIDKLQGKHFYSSAMLQSPFLTQTTSAWNGVVKLANGEEIRGRDLKAMIIVAGMLMNTSATGLVARPLAYSADWLQGNVVPDCALEMVRGLVVGNGAERTWTKSK